MSWPCGFPDLRRLSRDSDVSLENEGISRPCAELTNDIIPAMNIRNQKDGRGDSSISLIVPMFNEEAVCGQFFGRTIPILEGITSNYEVICVNDGSHERWVDRIVFFMYCDKYGIKGAVVAITVDE